MKVATLNQRIRDRVSPDWLTPSQLVVWEKLHLFNGPPHRIVNVYGSYGSGKSFLGWLMERERYATYALWSKQSAPVLSRLSLDNAATDRASSRSIRPLVNELAITQIILLSRQRVDEEAMPAFQLQVTPADMECFRANLYRHLDIIIPEDNQFNNYRSAIENYCREGI